MTSRARKRCCGLHDLLMSRIWYLSNHSGSGGGPQTVLTHENALLGPGAPPLAHARCSRARYPIVSRRTLSRFGMLLLSSLFFICIVLTSWCVLTLDVLPVDR